MDKIACCHFWMDCGGHFRTLDMCSYVATEWASSSSAYIPCTLSWFGEEHGKGEVDGFFSCAYRWIQSKICNPGTEIATSTRCSRRHAQGSFGHGLQDFGMEPREEAHAFMERHVWWRPHSQDILPGRALLCAMAKPCVQGGMLFLRKT